MGKTAQDSESVNIVRNRILTIKANGTWEQAAKRVGVSRGYLYRVAKGTRPASNTLRAKLGLPTKYAPHPVKRLTAIHKLLQNTYYKDS